MRILFVRHGQDDERYRGGWSNRGLIPEGKVQAQRLSTYLAKNVGEHTIRRMLSSDLTRAIQTAAYISEALDIPVTTDARLRETNNGVLAGMKNDEALVRYPGMFFRSLGMDEPYPDGESPRQFYERIRAWFTDTVTNAQETPGDTLVVTHGGVINVIYHLVRQQAWSNTAPPYPAAPCGLHVLNIETMTFEVENQTDYLI